MGYVIAAILVLALVAGFLTFMVVNATRRRSENPTDIVAPDESALGDTTEHSGEQAGVDPSEGRAPEPEHEQRDTRPESEQLANRQR